MNGPEHYREAETLLADADSSKLTTYEGDNPEADRTIATAQVHATLALAAATALLDETPRSDSFAAYRAWQEVAGAEPAAQPEPEAAPAVTSVFKAAWGMTPLGTYTNLSAAQTHCLADATNNSKDPEGLSFEWFGDAHEPGDPCELLLTVDGKQETTDYTVTRVEVDTEYDPEADA
ncbi:hypothetical protein EES45_23180 [Streptomyces sp. ADI97-07]|uniref:hypothetical protein n=1 Tax=Streptomyces sp. ADI97-07 TaxID=1522762 RepID=UPI000F9E2127|nr:hypothetical protein [Streptomyces sp. ADI97-07]RPK76398.1 hypothetical protein EES45_23180 [Streptomyces sp. ADI97-07]